MGYIKDERPATMMVNGTWDIGAYQYKTHGLLREFVDGLKERKLIGSLCPGCGKVIVPARKICGRCHMVQSEKMVVSNKGTITCFIVSPPMKKGSISAMGLDPIEMGLFKEGDVLIPVFVRFDGSDSNINTVLLNAEAKDVYIGMRVQAVWAPVPAGTLSDLEGVEPIPPEKGAAM